MNTKFYFLLLLFVVSYCNAFSASPQNIDWNTAKWIGFNNDNRPQEWSNRIASFGEWDAPKITKTRIAYLSPLMRKSFALTKKIESAQIAVAGIGLYELYVNGKKVGDRVLDPAQTSYEKFAFYVVHDVTKLLNPKQNAIGIMLGNGFYGQNAAYNFNLNYGQPRAIAILQLKYSDGTTETIGTDESWKASTGPVLFDNIFFGETYDARRVINNWISPAFDDKLWQTVEIMKSPTEKLVEQKLEPIRKIRTVLPKTILPAEEGWIIDMGQNMSGWLHMKVKEKAGTVIKMQYAEHLMPDRKNIDPASTGIHVTGHTQTDFYICSGKGVESWEPRFTSHGFRYVQITGLSKKPELKNFTGWLVRSDVTRTGTFECSDPLINKFYNVSLWTIESNIQGLLSDCPHRERCAWMGDTYVVAEAASFNFDMKKFWQKTAADIPTTLGKEKTHPLDSLPQDHRAPCNVGLGKRLNLQARPDWGAATVMVPWYSYVHYADTAIVKDSWSLMTGWMTYLDEIVQKNGIIIRGYGDWCPPGTNTAINTPVALTSTALYYQSLVAMQKMALVVDDTKASEAYAQKAIVVRNAFNQRFFEEKTYSYGSQTGNIFALFSQIVPVGKEQGVAERLADYIMKDSKGHYTTGIFGHRPLYTVLNDYGHADVTKHLWTLTTYPSLGFMTEVHNLTTWAENPYDWPIGERYRRNSYNHPMQAGFAASFHESLGGIRPDENKPGYKAFFLRPKFVPDLNWVKVTLKTQFGTISSAWKRKKGSVVWSVTVPKNTTAQVQLLTYNKKDIKLNNKVVQSNSFTLIAGKHIIVVAEKL